MKLQKSILAALRPTLFTIGHVPLCERCFAPTDSLRGKHSVIFNWMEGDSILISAVVTFPVYVASTVDSWSSIIARLLIVLIAVSVVVD